MQVAADDGGPTVIASRYQIQREIGRGGAGVVYAVKHVHTGERLAMKVLLSHAVDQPDIVQRFRREMQASARVRSENVVRITDADVAPELGGAPFLIMELLSGTDLGNLVVERGACPKEEVLWILGQAARGLDRAHAAQIVHRDLKPENLFLHRCDDGRLVIKLLDFGIARMTDGSGLAASEARMTQDGAILGTPLFLTPEQALGETEKIGPTTDVWPMGLIAYELLTGGSYWAEEQMTTLLAKIIFKPLLAPSTKGATLGPLFDSWFLKSCAREPGQRWSSVGAQVEALAEALEVDRAIWSAAEPPAALRSWLLARSARAEAAKPSAVSLANITGTSMPKRSSSPSVGSAPAASEVTAPAVESQSAVDGQVASPRWRLSTRVALAGTLVLLLLLGVIGLGRMSPAPRPSIPTPSGPKPQTSAALPAPPAAVPTPPRAGPKTAPAEATEPVATRPKKKSRRGRSEDKSVATGASAKGSGGTTNTGAYDPAAP